MEIQQLRCFVTVAEHGSFSKAAQALRLSQPSLSQAVARLETEFGTQLFHRSARGVSLTASGESLIGSARQVLQAVGNTQAAVDSLHGLTIGELSVVTFSTFTSPTSDVMAAFRQAYSGVRLRVHDPTDADSIFALIESGACEIGFALFYQGSGVIRRYPGIELHPVAVDESVVLVPQDSDLGGSDEPIGLADVARLPLVAGTPGGPGRAQLEELFASAQVEPDVVVACDDHETSVELVARGVGAYFTTRGHVEGEQMRGVTVRAVTPNRPWPIGLVHSAGQLSPAAAAFKELAIRHFDASVDPARELFDGLEKPRRKR